MVIGYWAGTCHTLHSNRPFLQKEGKKAEVLLPWCRAAFKCRKLSVEEEPQQVRPEAHLAQKPV